MAFDGSAWLASLLGSRSPLWDQRPYITCVICDEECDCPFGHNPAPLFAPAVGRCCDRCNHELVGPARIELLAQGGNIELGAQLRQKAAKVKAAKTEAAKAEAAKAEAAKAEAAKAAEAKAAAARATAAKDQRKKEMAEARQRAMDAAKVDAMIARVSRRCVDKAVGQMPAMIEAKARDAAAKRKAAALRTLNAAAGFKAAKAAKAAREQRAEEKQARKRNA